MGVVGVGVDAIEIVRVRRAVQRTPALLARVFTELERAHCTSSCGDLRFGGLASRFAAKEAVAKALGSGFHRFSFRDIEVVNNNAGKPEVVLHEGARARAAQIGAGVVHLSLSTTHELAVAHAVAEAGS